MAIFAPRPAARLRPMRSVAALYSRGRGVSCTDSLGLSPVDFGAIPVPPQYALFVGAVLCPARGRGRTPPLQLLSNRPLRRLVLRVRDLRRPFDRPFDRDL